MMNVLWAVVPMAIIFVLAASGDSMASKWIGYEFALNLGAIAWLLFDPQWFECAIMAQLVGCALPSIFFRNAKHTHATNHSVDDKPKPS